jgi:hypothetical protein
MKLDLEKPVAWIEGSAETLTYSISCNIIETKNT